MLKVLGAVLIIAAGAAFGFYQAAQLARRPRQLADLIRMLQRLETEIVYGFTPLAEALRRTGQSGGTPAGRVLADAGTELERAHGQSVRAVWQTAITEGWRHTSMKTPERDIVLQLGATLGLTDRDDQVKHLRLAASQLQGEADTARDERERYERMWKSLGVLMGLLIVILMY